MIVEYRQRVTSAAVEQGEVTLKIRLPQFIAFFSLKSLIWFVFEALSWVYAIVPLEDVIAGFYLFS